MIPGEENIISQPLVRPEKVYFTLFHIKFGLMKISVKVVDINVQGFLFLKIKFPRICDAKIKEYIFVVPHTGAYEILGKKFKC